MQILSSKTSTLRCLNEKKRGSNSNEKILWQDLLFFRNLRDAPDVSVALLDDERNTFYHHHRSVEAQCLRLVDAYLADKSVESHQQVLLTVGGTLRIIYTMNDDEPEIARYSVLTKRRIGAF